MTLPLVLSCTPPRLDLLTPLPRDVAVPSRDVLRNAGALHEHYQESQLLDHGYFRRSLNLDSREGLAGGGLVECRHRVSSLVAENAGDHLALSERDWIQGTL